MRFELILELKPGQPVRIVGDTPDELQAAAHLAIDLMDPPRSRPIPAKRRGRKRNAWTAAREFATAKKIPLTAARKQLAAKKTAKAKAA